MSERVPSQWKRVWLALAIAAITFQKAEADITGGVGNTPIANPGWPKGAETLFNTTARVAWWEGPPFGGGQYTAECRGDAKAFNAVLAGFAKLDVKTKRLYVHDGVGHSFWLNMNREPAKEAEARIDWSFMVWNPKNWDHLRTMPSDINPASARDKENGPPSQIDVYTGGNLRWADLVIPAGIEVNDMRLEAHGFTPADGIVLEGKVIDLATKQPLAAQMRLERIEPQAKGGYLYPKVAEAVADAQGRWTLKKTPIGWFRVVIEADGFVPRVVGYAQFDDQPSWHSYNSGLSRPSSVSGRVTDDKNQPIADVEVTLHDVESNVDGRYVSPKEYRFKTDVNGRFLAEQIPIGRASIWVHKPGYIRPGLGHPIATPTKPLELGLTQVVSLVMIKSAKLQIIVDFTGTQRPSGYIVTVEAEGGGGVGKWGASGNIDDKNQVTYEHIPPGRYVVQGQPNPSSADQHTKPITVELKGDETKAITLLAK